MTKTHSHLCGWNNYVLNFEHSDFDIVSNFDIRVLVYFAAILSKDLFIR